MSRIDCKKCEHYRRQDCDLGFRWASGSAGQEVDDVHDVYRCRDFSETENDEEMED